tara:strand:+ start:457 stop:2019 length:1563 start_codon:yes stop_codon:yes gene_type:complete
MDNVRGKILWVDDEIHHLKPHVLFLEEKGYQLFQASNGQDAISLAKSNSFDLVLLDQSMPGMDGLETLNKLKKIRQNQIIIMITKTEDEWLMDEAINSQIEHFLIKPVNPSQIFMACKQILEKNKLQEQKATSDYLLSFSNIDSKLSTGLNSDEWFDLYNDLVDWQIKFDRYKDIGLTNILFDQIQSCNKEFVNFFLSNYLEWLNSTNRPLFPNDIIKNCLSPKLENNEKVCLLVIDCMRLDQFKSLMPLLDPFFEIDLRYSFSLLPSATQYSRNAIFCGMFPDEMVKNYPNQANDMKLEANSLNQYENLFLKDNLNRLGYKNKSIHYHKIWAVDEGKKFQNRISDYAQKDLLAIVVNFVDLLAHKTSQMDILRELVPDESGYRTAVRSWLEQSWLYDVLKYFGKNGWSVILTSDHGSIRVKNSLMVAADKGASSGLRFKFGRNLNTNQKNALIIKEPDIYKLPSFGYQPSYLIAKYDNYFVYPNEASKYQTKFKNTFQHGGVSMEEIIVPLALMKGRGF